ncbi:UNVERIFIED_CONTAM: hypothetical protein Slati_1690400 [Sesamum latifolium]|uniref:Reverse transcriptase zinc-binding domain-containing protein n=1 Tax=Sesamum latifolium TaxID=2727402 RepID=A0AAW2WVY4_9LAMI
MEHREITDTLPQMGHTDSIRWINSTGFTSVEAYGLFQPPGPKVNWYSLLLGPYRIARNYFVLWLALLDRLTSLDRSWWQGSDRTCILCTHGELETHDHLFFGCDFLETVPTDFEVRGQFYITFHYMETECGLGKS